MVHEIYVNKNEYLPTAIFKPVQIKYQKFNPVQSTFLKVYSKNANTVIAASTSAGKTVIAEMAFADAISNDRKAIYLCPLKALAQEKIDDWRDPSHPFSEYQLAIATGDYVAPGQRDETLKKAAASDITMMTSELLDSLTRRVDKVTEWFQKVGVLVVDEAHLLTKKKRGSALECALMRFSKMSDAKIIFLSATMSNTKELAGCLLSTGKSLILLRQTGGLASSIYGTSRLMILGNILK